jgi:hypothetical protein
VNLVLVSTYRCYVGSLSEIRTAVRGWEKAILFTLLESVLRIPTTEVFSVATTKAFALGDQGRQFLIAGLARQNLPRGTGCEAGRRQTVKVDS